MSLTEPEPLPVPARTSIPDRMIGLGSEDEVVAAAAEVTLFAGENLLSLLADAEDAGVSDGELLAGDAERRFLPSSSSSSSTATAATDADLADSDETLDENEDRLLSSLPGHDAGCGGAATAESVTLISTEPDLDLESRRSPPWGRFYE
jgi:hypothetical protein